MKTNMAFISQFCVGALLLLAASASAQEQEIECKDVPTAVRTAFQKAYPNATIKDCAKEVEDDKTAYEISSTEGKTRRDILYYEDGALIVVEETIDATDLPKDVQQAVSDVLADHKIELVEKLTRDDTVTYEIKSQHADVALEIVFDGNGKVLKIAAAGAEASPAGEEGEEKSESGGEKDEDEEEGGEK